MTLGELPNEEFVDWELLVQKLRVHLSAVELAEHTHCRRSMVNAWRRGERVPVKYGTIRALLSLADRLLSEQERRECGLPA